MLGYVGAETQTLDVFSADGFMKTGDIGYIDEDGFVFLVGRAKEMIEVRGWVTIVAVISESSLHANKPCKSHQVAPAEIEALLLSHALVADAAVKGVYCDSSASEVPVGYVTTFVQGLDRERVIEELKLLFDSKVARYKRLAGGIHVMENIPRK